MEQIDTVLQKLEQLHTEQKVLSTLLTQTCLTLVDGMKVVREANKSARMRDSKYWQMLMQKQVLKPVKRVYAFLYVDKMDPTTRRLLLAAADVFEDASAIADALLSKETNDASRWVIEGYQHIDIPVAVEEASDVNADTTAAITGSKEVSYIHNLMLAKDRFAKTPLEKAALTNIIRRLRRSTIEK